MVERVGFYCSTTRLLEVKYGPLVGVPLLLELFLVLRRSFFDVLESLLQLACLDVHLVLAGDCQVVGCLRDEKAAGVGQHSITAGKLRAV